MPRTPLGRKFIRALRLSQALQQHPELSLDELIAKQDHARLHSRRQFFKIGGALGVGGVLAACRPIAPPPPRSPASLSTTQVAGPSIAIVGAGLAGLNAAHQLKKSGHRATIYEAADRVGGRIFTAQDLFAPGIFTDLGAELIDSKHADMHALAKEFGLSLLDYEDPSIQSLRDYYYFDGKLQTERNIIDALIPIVAKMSADSERLDNNWDQVSVELDQLSVADYLDRLGVGGWIRSLITQVVTSEFGIEIEAMTALQWLWLIPIADGDKLSVLGESDERYHMVGGSQRLTDMLAKTLQDQIQTGRVLEAIRSQGSGYTLSFQGGSEVQADHVIITLPFTLLREVKLDVPLPDTLKQFIQEVDYGRNAKVLASYNTRIWQTQGFSGLGYTEDRYLNGWDSSLLQTGTIGVLNYYLGGKEGLAAGQGTPESHAKDYTALLDKIIPGLAQAWTGKAQRMHWPSYKWSKGSYAYFKPGQFTKFIQQHIYYEDGSNDAPVAVDNLVFAGEHLSFEFQGYMNGAAQTGRLAANAVLAKVASPQAQPSAK